MCHDSHASRWHAWQRCLRCWAYIRSRRSRFDAVANPRRSHRCLAVAALVALVVALIAAAALTIDSSAPVLPVAWTHVEAALGGDAPLGRGGCDAKAFFVGFHKTGTSRISSFFASPPYALRVTHGFEWRLGDARALRRADVFTDGCGHAARRLVARCDSHGAFVYNTRAARSWIASELSWSFAQRARALEPRRGAAAPASGGPDRFGLADAVRRRPALHDATSRASYGCATERLGAAGARALAWRRLETERTLAAVFRVVGEANATAREATARAANATAARRPPLLVWALAEGLAPWATLVAFLNERRRAAAAARPRADGAPPRSALLPPPPSAAAARRCENTSPAPWCARAAAARAADDALSDPALRDAIREHCATAETAAFCAGGAWAAAARSDGGCAREPPSEAAARASGAQLERALREGDVACATVCVCMRWRGRRRAQASRP